MTKPLCNSRNVNPRVQPVSLFILDRNRGIGQSQGLARARFSMAIRRDPDRKFLFGRYPTVYDLL